MKITKIEKILQEMRSPHEERVRKSADDLKNLLEGKVTERIKERIQNDGLGEYFHRITGESLIDILTGKED